MSLHSLLHRRRYLKPGLLGVVAVVCAGCARFPANGTSGFTAITFTFRVAGKINTTADSDPSTYYIYDVAINASSDPNPIPTYAPTPVVNASSPNGRVGGSPTHFIEFNSLNPTSSPPFTLYRFAKSSEVPNPNDPTNPINLAVYSQSNRRPIINYTTPQNGGDPATLSFTIYTDQLADTDAEAKLLQTLQVNILTMTRPANQGSGSRVIDGLGNSSSLATLNNYLQINLLQTGTYTNSGGFEPTGDTYGGTDPDVDIIDYTVTVTHP